MPVYAMKVTAKKAHEKTDKLFIYTFESPALGQRTIVANLTIHSQTFMAAKMK